MNPLDCQQLRRRLLIQHLTSFRLKKELIHFPVAGEQDELGLEGVKHVGERLLRGGEKNLGIPSGEGLHLPPMIESPIWIVPFRA